MFVVKSRADPVLRGRSFGHSFLDRFEACRMRQEDREKMKSSAVAEIGGNWNYQSNCSVRILNIVDIERRRAVNLEIVQ